MINRHSHNMNHRRVSSHIQTHSKTIRHDNRFLDDSSIRGRSNSQPYAPKADGKRFREFLQTLGFEGGDVVGETRRIVDESKYIESRQAQEMVLRRVV